MKRYKIEESDGSYVLYEYTILLNRTKDETGGFTETETVHSIVQVFKGTVQDCYYIALLLNMGIYQV